MTKSITTGAAIIRTTLRATVAAMLILSAGGCASSGQLSGQASGQPTQPEQASATHYWESSASSREYRTDNAACAQKTEVDADGVLDPKSTTFDAYRDCMIEQGYTLRTY